MKAVMIRYSTALMALLALGTGQVLAQPQLPQMMVTSEAFEDGGVVPEKYAFRGDNVQPNFTITNAPDDTESYAIIFHDLDVALNGSTNDVLHWLAWNIPSGEIPEGRLPEGSMEGTNLMGQQSYFGPGAPAGERYHHYVFEFYALNEDLDLSSDAGREELLEAMDGKVVAKAAYVGRYRGSEE